MFFGSNAFLICAHHLEQLLAELLAHVFRARDADAVLGGERTFELPHQRRRLIGDLAEFFQSAALCRSSTGRTCNSPLAAWP